MNRNEKHSLLRLNIFGFFTALIIMSVIFIKYAEFGKINTLVYFYTICVAVFQLSIMIASFIYCCDKKWRNNGYEPTVTFVVPAKNEEKVIAKTIERCYDVEYPKNKIEVIVINDGSTDDTWKEIEKIKKVYTELVAINWQKNRGKKHAMIEGFRKAIGDIIIQLDSDSYLQRDSLRKLVEPFKDSNIGGIAAHTDPENIDNILTRTQSAYYFSSFRAIKATESLFDSVFCCSGCCSAYRKNAVLPILDEWIRQTFMSKSMMWDDDRSLTNLVLKSGYRTIYMSSAQAYTIVPNNIKHFLKQQVRWKKSWFVCSIDAFKFMFKKDKFVAIAYLLPITITTLLTPFISFNALIIDPLVNGVYPTIYIFGVFIITAITTIHYQYFRNDGNWRYMFVWTFLDLTILSYLMFYALIDLRNTGWGTR